MECCPMCLELYDQQRVAKNLLCGHSYCLICLDHIYSLKARIQCPLCRLQHDPLIQPSHLSKNYIAMDLASKQLEIQNKLLFCTLHPKHPLQFFCEDDSTNLCTECIIEHSGHKFCKQEHSITLLKQKVFKIQKDLNKQIDNLKQNIKFIELSFEKLNESYNHQVIQVDQEIDKLIKYLEERRIILKDNLKEQQHKKIIKIQKDQLENKSWLQKILNEQKSVDGTIEKLSQLTVIKDDQFIKELQSLQESINQDLEQIKKLMLPDFTQSYRITFSKQIYEEISNFGQIQQSLLNPKICFFGDKHKILILDVEKDEWTYKTQTQFEFNYYQSSCTLPTGEIIITGGGQSNNVLLVNPNKEFKINRLSKMIDCRKEHGTVYVDGYVYVIGGYDGQMQQMLASCEKYSLKKHEWSSICRLNSPKCAFGTASWENKFIYVFGGFNGMIRLNEIERYNIKENRWSILDVKLKYNLSNTSAIYTENDQILILGGGCDMGYVLDLFEYDCKTECIKSLQRMKEGRDLRNKLSYINGQLYVCGGNNCTGEKYIKNRNQWVELKNYNYFICDNLDSWCSSYSFEQESQMKSILDDVCDINNFEDEVENEQEINRRIFLQI